MEISILINSRAKFVFEFNSVNFENILIDFVASNISVLHHYL